MKPCTIARSTFFTIAAACLTACGGNSVPAPPQPPDIYAVGFELQGNLYKAVLWKNNVLTVLDSGSYGPAPSRSPSPMGTPMSRDSKAAQAEMTSPSFGPTALQPR